MSSATAPVTMRSTRTSGASFAMLCGSGFDFFGGLELSATPPASVLWAMAAEDDFEVTGIAKLLGSARGIGRLADAALRAREGRKFFRSILASMFAQRSISPLPRCGRCGQCRQRFVARPSCGR